MFSIHFEKLASFDRNHEVCQLSIPFQQGELHSIHQFQIYNSDKKSVAMQSKVLSTWQDGSIRWLFVYFLADLKANKASTYFGDLVEQNVDSDQLLKQLATEAVLNKRLSYDFISPTQLELSMEGNPISFQMEATLKQKNGFEIKANLTTAKLTPLHEGPLVQQYRGKGFYSDGLEVEWTLRHDFAKPWIQVDYRLINTGEKDLELEEILIQIQPKQKKATASYGAVATSNYKTKIQKANLQEQNVKLLIDGDYLMYNANEHFPETFYGTAFADFYLPEYQTGLCATHYQAYQNFPKGMSVTQDGLILEILPKMPEPLIFYSGMAKSHTFFLHFHEDAIEAPSLESYSEILSSLNLQSLHFQMPDQPYIDAQIYAKAKVFEAIYSKMPSHEIDQKLVNKADQRSRGFGILHWGDAPDMNYTNQGRGGGKLVWTNNEYDFPHAAMLLYTKTGVRRLRNYCEVAARHQMDVDICHTPSQGLRFLGQIEHGKDHHGGDVKPCHQWVEGLLDYYHLTGEIQALEAALGIGENILILLKQAKYQQSTGINARETGWAMRSLLGLYRETYDEKWMAPNEKIIQQFKEWYNTYGGWLSPYTDHSVIRVPFMISVAVGSLMRYYRLRPDESLKKLILAAVDDLCDHCILPDGSFYYKELPSLQRPSYNPLVLEALAVAYELSQDSKYLKVGRKTFEKLGQDGTPSEGKRLYDTYTLVTGGYGPKAFAQSYLPLAFFQKQISDLNFSQN